MFVIITRYAANAKNGVLRIALREKIKNMIQKSNALISIRRRLNTNEINDKNISIL